MQIVLKIQGREIAIECAEHERRRLEDLAAALEARLAAGSGETSRRLVLTALALIDEAQTTSAALERARCEIERLTDMLVEANLPSPKPPPVAEDRGRVAALRAEQGAA
jgi:hypothetical protein